MRKYSTIKSKLLILVLLVSFGELVACSCKNQPKTFFKHFQEDHIVASAIVLEHQLIPINLKYYISHYSVSKLKVTKWYQNSMKTDTVYYANGKGHECVNSIHGIGVGSHVIVKAVKSDVYSNWFDQTSLDLNHFKKHTQVLEDKLFIGNTSCDVSILTISGDVISGNITRNKEALRNKFKKLVSYFNNNFADLLYKKSTLRIERMSLNEFDKLIKTKSKYI